MMNSHKFFINSLILLISLMAAVPSSFAQEKKPSFFNKWGSRAFSGAYYAAGMALPAMGLYSLYLGKDPYEEKVTYERIAGQEELVAVHRGAKKITDEEYAQNIRNVIRKAGIKNPESVMLVHNDFTAADSVENCMMVGSEDEDFHSQVNPEVPYPYAPDVLSPAMQFTIAHETRHLINKDSQRARLANLTISPAFCLGIRFATQSLWKNTSTLQAFLAKNLSKLAIGATIHVGSKAIRNLAFTTRERIADQEAAHLIGSEATRANANLLEQFRTIQRQKYGQFYDFMEKYPIIYHMGSSHPIEKERIEYLNKIADELEVIEKAKNEKQL